MEAYVVDAFTKTPYGGNAAGVVLLAQAYPPERDMLALAARLGFSETVFLLPLSDGTFRLRYFTPTAEVDLCGHATVAAFHTLVHFGTLRAGQSYTAKTLVGNITVDIDPDGCVWLDMAPPRELGGLSAEDTAALYAMFGLAASDAGALAPAIVDTGLPDIMMPVASRALLAALKPDYSAISALSKALEVTGVHVFAPGDAAVTAYVRNFAPLYGIDEEAATGTSNGALSYYLYRRGHIRAGEVNIFLQGEAMGHPSEIRSRLTKDGDNVKIRIGGFAAMRTKEARFGSEQ